MVEIDYDPESDMTYREQLIREEFSFYFTDGDPYVGDVREPKENRSLTCERCGDGPFGNFGALSQHRGSTKCDPQQTND